jgi:hypothetical protein
MFRKNSGQIRRGGQRGGRGRPQFVRGQQRGQMRS